MSANVEIVRRFAAEFLGRADLAAADDLIAEDVIVTTGLSPAEPLRGRATYKQVIEEFAKAFPVGVMDIHEVTSVAADRVLLRFTAHARHVGAYYGVPASGRDVPMHEIHLIRLTDGKISENYVGAVNLVFEMIMAPVMVPMVLK